MKLADLSDDAVIELAREGGVAWIPALSGMRKIVVAKLNEQQKQRIATILQQSLPLGKPPGQPDSPGRGDQRFSHPDRQRAALPQPDYSHSGGSCARFTG